MSYLNKNKLGVNLTSVLYMNNIMSFIENKEADYIELLIDNFLCCDPKSITESLKGVPVAFHIMNSQFIERKESDLLKVGMVLRQLIHELKPIYVSDHLAKFNSIDLPIPILDEIDYELIEIISYKVSFWQEILNTQLFLENYPSYTQQGHLQPEAFTEIIKNTGCNILFDISNALLAYKNANISIDKWFPIIKNTNHFHVGGFSKLSDNNIYVDSHDQSLADETKELINSLSEVIFKNSNKTLTIEYDHNINYAKWSEDLIFMRHLI
jgi:uncharacterized protein (UPF0276 family)